MTRTLLRALLQGEMTLLRLLATATPTGCVPAQLARPSGARAWCLWHRVYPGQSALRGRARSVIISVELGDKVAARGIRAVKLVLLRLRQRPASIFDGTTQFNKDVIGEGVGSLTDWEGIEGLGEDVQRTAIAIVDQIMRAELRGPLEGVQEDRLNPLVVDPPLTHDAGQPVAEGVPRRRGIRRNTALEGGRAECAQRGGRLLDQQVELVGLV